MVNESWHIVLVVITLATLFVCLYIANSSKEDSKMRNLSINAPTNTEWKNNFNNICMPRCQSQLDRSKYTYASGYDVEGAWAAMMDCASKCANALKSK